MQNVGHIYDKYFNVLEPALKSKAEELGLIGYGQVTIKDLWSYLTKKKWKKPKDDIHVYELVSDVLGLKAGDYMNFATIEAYRTPNWFAELDEEELQDLLKPNKK
ncbi:post-transcriptional regulator [Heyndrickxia sp. NPDC080065]|uniref:post-transcriptional regulator n=1 Tax=Heyndrickxia sp. NPDC080065 TaxID=3390568 RepID=UPI003D02B11F